jgi:hypothetical protein
MKLHGIAVLTAILAFDVAAEDVGHTIAVWGPIPTREPEGWQPFVQGIGFASGAERLRGTYVVDRGTGVDVAAIVGLDWFETDIGKNRYNWFPTMNQGRLYARVSSDPLADEGGSGLGAIGAMWTSNWMISAHGEVGSSRDRGTISVLELSIPILRYHFEIDDAMTTTRVGLGPRWNGGATPWAGGIILDKVRSSPEPDLGLPSVSTFGAQAYVDYRPWNHGLIGLHIEWLHDAIDIHDGSEHSDRSQATIVFGTTW